MASSPDFRWETIKEDQLREIYDSDQAMYPAPQLTYDRLKSWVDACPALCLGLQRAGGRGLAVAPGLPTTQPVDGSEQQWDSAGTIHGLIIVLPLRQPYWDRLRRADMEEHDVEVADMFPPPPAGGSGGEEEGTSGAPGGTTKVGLHVFHIERLPGFVAIWKDAKFAALALEEIRGRVAQTFKAWEVVGYSALTATKQGSAAFKRLGFASSDSASGNTFLTQEAEMVERMGNAAFL